MGTTIGMLALSLSPSAAAPFASLSKETREIFLQGLSTSMVGLKRKAFVSLRQLICIKAVRRENSLFSYICPIKNKHNVLVSKMYSLFFSIFLLLLFDFFFSSSFLYNKSSF